MVTLENFTAFAVLKSEIEWNSVLQCIIIAPGQSDS